MAPSLLLPPTHLNPAAALHLSQQAPFILQSSQNAVSLSPLSALFSATESAELWTKYENLVLSCLRTGDDHAAHQCLERLVIRFGADSERVMALEGLVKEAEASNQGALEAVLKQYDEVLSETSTNIPIAKRRVALLRSLDRVSDAVAALVQLLDFSPTDPEAWSELSDLYLTQGMYTQAIYALEEVLILVPNAWNIHARLGEIQYMAATATDAPAATFGKHIAESLKRFARCIELCDNYLRGYYGLKLVTTRLLKETNPPKKQNSDGDFVLPDLATVEKLNELATNKLGEIVRRSSAKERLWRGYDEAEIAAACDFLAQSSKSRKMDGVDGRRHD